ncbi:MAG: hypothetical protein DRR08_21745 [Candidatus Parabeggiatoa sp. nov. 2]|nr:MAG: hypothetical protein B6247_14880 [Beggiatoa sp. 4572_84]RKZ56423.1 MAG: hypothetical protein DRR08_21745 [Gammaproteobacteria bacterium]HEC83905.1 ABC transporter substrate-binding protein [Thioploca sp.]
MSFTLLMSIPSQKSQGQTHLLFVFLIIGLIVLVIGSLEWLPLLKKEPSSPYVITETGTSSFPRELRDAAGNTLIIPSRPQRIVSQTLATDEILLAICPLERIAAVTTLARDEKYSNVVEEARTIGQVGEHVEQILGLNPDLIFVANYNRAETVELLQTTGAPVFRFAHFRNVADIKNNIKVIGYAIGEEQRAAAIVAQMERDIKAIRASIPADAERLRVMSYSLGNYTAGRYTTFDNIVNIVGAINVATEHGIEQHAKISDEQILVWQPDFIVTHAAQGEFAQVRRQLLENPAIAASEAGKAGRIIVIDNRYFLSVSHYVVYGIKRLAEKLWSPNFSLAVPSKL